ncbi:MAG: YkvA family protein [Myxococcota bacterium]
MKVSFELSNRDLAYFRDRLKRIRKSLDTGDERRVLRGATSMMQEARDSNPPEFVLERLVKLEQLIAMLRDGEWRLEGRDRVRILDALAYFVDPEDMIPDRLPGIGYLDDAIMVELICQELRHEIKAYEDFCAFRETKGQDPDSLEARRKGLQARMRRRNRRDREAARDRPRGRSPFRLF